MGLARGLARRYGMRRVGGDERRVTDEWSGVMTAREAPHRKAQVSGLIEVTSL